MSAIDEAMEIGREHGIEDLVAFLGEMSMEQTARLGLHLAVRLSLTHAEGHPINRSVVGDALADAFAYALEIRY